MKDKLLRKQKKEAARKEREEQQARRVIYGIVGALIILAIVLIGVSSFL
ncbi:MAG: hypothetical protein HUK02_01275 [Bacteroidaceae bacterium]|nr:hypothetical protein [Bacteroidaceae bacterium]